MDSATQTPLLEPLPYHIALADHLASTEDEAWRWFSDSLAGPEHAEKVRLDLLKATYRIDRESKPELYALADKAKSVLGVTAPLTLYQMQQAPDGGMNAVLFYLPGEMHITFVGPVLERLGESELLALFGHEIGHFMLLELFEGRYRIVEELLHALVQDQSAQPAHEESYRLFHLYKEILCDRASVMACEDLHASITMLVKMETGASDVSAESYLKQAAEVFSKSAVKTDGLSHPECFIRARALELWSQRPEDLEEQVNRLIEGGPSLDGMDLLGQKRITELTRKLVDSLLAEKWIRCEPVLAHARLFFEDYHPPEVPPTEEELKPLLEVKDEKLAKYLCYVLLDFVASDREIEEPALAAVLVLCRQLKLEKYFRPIATKELKLKKRQFDKLEKEAEDILAAARKSPEAQE